MTTAEERKASWAYLYDRKRGEFHGPNNFYWYGRACCKWRAKAQGWIEWCNKLQENQCDHNQI